MPRCPGNRMRSRGAAGSSSDQREIVPCCEPTARNLPSGENASVRVKKPSAGFPGSEATPAIDRLVVLKRVTLPSRSATASSFPSRPREILLGPSGRVAARSSLARTKFAPAARSSARREGPGIHAARSCRSCLRAGRSGSTGKQAQRDRFHREADGVIRSRTRARRRAAHRQTGAAGASVMNREGSSTRVVWSGVSAFQR